MGSDRLLTWDFAEDTTYRARSKDLCPPLRLSYLSIPNRREEIL